MCSQTVMVGPSTHARAAPVRYGRKIAAPSTPTSRICRTELNWVDGDDGWIEGDDDKKNE